MITKILRELGQGQHHQLGLKEAETIENKTVPWAHKLQMSGSRFRKVLSCKHELLIKTKVNSECRVKINF